VLREVSHNKNFINALLSNRDYDADRLAIVQTENQHVKGLVGELFMIDGSMNFTHNGIEINDEHVLYRCDQQSIQECRLNFLERWGRELFWRPNG
jgi:hypothetical protein